MITHIKKEKTRVMLIWPQTGARNYIAPVGLGYLGAVLEQRGCEVLIIDASATTANYTEDDLLREALNFSPDLIGITFNIFLTLSAYSLAEKLKSLSVPLVAGGPHPSSRPYEALSRSFDLVVRQEGERTILDLVDHIEGNRSLSEIRGISYLDGEQLVNNPDQPLVEDLDQLPFPSLHLFRREDYRGYGAEFSSHLVGTRGCPFNCSFCFKVFGGRSIRWRSAESLIEEMKLMNKAFGTTFFRFVDEFFACDRKRVARFCELLLENDLKFGWFANSRVDSLDSDLLKLMMKSGCGELAFGFESGDENTWSELNTQASTEKSEQVMRLMKDVGIRVRGYIMFGFPWDTEESVGNTLRFLKKNEGLIDSYLPLSYYVPFPNTPLYERYAEQYNFEGWWLDKNFLDRYAPHDHMPIHHILLFGDMKMRWKKAFIPLDWRTKRLCRK